eukprot:INCI6363.1.p1 GENE.INCI6363.1~~INCI6363.1.p1  ORF type:complete len:255 (-),score=30.44 INCI6363.1:226-990(-)
MPLPATSSSTPSPAPGAAATSARNAEAPQGTTTAAATVAEPTVPLFTMEQVQTMARQRRRCVLVIHGDVVDVPQSVSVHCSAVHSCALLPLPLRVSTRLDFSATMTRNLSLLTSSSFCFFRSIGARMLHRVFSPLRRILGRSRLVDSRFGPLQFMLEHPGGFAIINNENGTDATVYFEDIGHSTDARRCVQSFKIGRLEGAPATLAGESAGTSSNLEAASAAAKALAAKNGFDKLSAAVSAIVFASTLVLLLVS